LAIVKSPALSEQQSPENYLTGYPCKSASNWT